MTVTAAIVRACRQFQLAKLPMASDAKVMKCFFCVAGWSFDVLRLCILRSRLNDPADGVIFGLVTAVTALDRVISGFKRVVTGCTCHCLEFAVALVAKGYRAELRRQRDHGLVRRYSIHCGRKCGQHKRNYVQPCRQSGGVRDVHLSLASTHLRLSFVPVVGLLRIRRGCSRMRQQIFQARNCSMVPGIDASLVALMASVTPQPTQARCFLLGTS